MSVDAPADPLANDGVKGILQQFWNNSQNGDVFSGAQIGPLDSGLWYHTGSNNFEEWEQYKKTSGFHPKILSIPLAYYRYNTNWSYHVPSTGTAYTDIKGGLPLDLSFVNGKIGEHFLSGGFCKFMDVPENPTAFSASTKPRSGTVTIASINTSGLLKLLAVDQFLVYPMEQNSGCFTILDTAGVLHYGTYTGMLNSSGASWGASTVTGLGYLSGVVIDGTTSATISNAASDVSVARLAAPKSSMSSAANTGAWPLHYSSSAYTYLNAYTLRSTLALTTTDYTNSLTVNANFNLNRYLDYLAAGIRALEFFGIPVILRLMPEPNIGAWWYNGCKSTWYAHLWRYCIAYLTGNPSRAGTPIGFTGQPTAGSTGIAGAAACHNILFMWGMAAGTAITGIAAPEASLVDLVGLEYYNTSAATLHTDLTTVQSYGCGNKPTGVAESYSNIVNTVLCSAVCSTTDDLNSIPSSTITLYENWAFYTGLGAPTAAVNGAWVSGSYALNATVTKNGSVWKSSAGTNTNDPNPSNDGITPGTNWALTNIRPPATGVLMIPTANGIIRVSYTGVTFTPGFVTLDGVLIGKYVFTGCSVFGGAPVGSKMIYKGMATVQDSGASTAASLLSALKATNTGNAAPYPAYNIMWDGSSGYTNCELYIPDFPSTLQDSKMKNKTPGNWRTWSHSKWSMV